MRTIRRAEVAALVVMACTAWARPASAKCPVDSVAVGPLCVDKYEASVWEIDSTKKSLIKRVQKGSIKAEADLTGGGGTQHGIASADYGSACPASGEGCSDMYAVSIPGVKPSRYISWLQAQQACTNSGKRLLTNAEWQAAASGTPDGATDDGVQSCDSNSGDTVNTGSRSLCVSTRGAYDMVGNVIELVADWADVASSCTTWSQVGLGNNLSCFGGDGTTSDRRLPAAIVRGGTYNNLGSAGVLMIQAFVSPGTGNQYIGFRCAR